MNKPKQILYFYSPDCGPCKDIKAYLDVQEILHNDIELIRYDLYEFKDKKMLKLHDITKTPTFLCFYNNVFTYKHTGADIDAIDVMYTALGKLSAVPAPSVPSPSVPSPSEGSA